MVVLDSGFSNADVASLTVATVALVFAVIALVVSIGQYHLAQDQASLAKKQTELAEAQHKLTLEQLAKSPDLELIVHGVMSDRISPEGSPVIAVRARYMLAVRNTGSRTAEKVSWTMFIRDDPRLGFHGMPSGFDMNALFKTENGHEIYKGTGFSTEPVFAKGGITDLFELTVTGPSDGMTIVRPVLEWRLRADDGSMFPPDAKGILTFETVGFKKPQTLPARVSSD